MKTLAVIPARYASSRLPGKAIIPIAGTPLVIRVLSNVQKCNNIDKVVVATDDSRIADVVKEYGGDVIMTPADLPSGGDRVAWVSREIPSEFVLNVQVDDPLVNNKMIDPLVVELERDSSIMLALLAKRIEQMEEVVAEDCVKMVFDRDGKALYFSRSPIPYPIKEDGIWFKHIGPYAWRRDFLLEFSSWEQTPLERAESLEMLRVLEKGYSIKCVITEDDTIEIDTPQDLEKIESFFSRLGDREQ